MYEGQLAAQPVAQPAAPLLQTFNQFFTSSAQPFSARFRISIFSPVYRWALFFLLHD
jgi:hypothetical protein